MVDIVSTQYDEQTGTSTATITVVLPPRLPNQMHLILACNGIPANGIMININDPNFTKIAEAGNSTNDVHTAAFWGNQNTVGGESIILDTNYSSTSWAVYTLVLFNVDTVDPILIVGNLYNATGSSTIHTIDGFVPPSFSPDQMGFLIAGADGSTREVTITTSGNWVELNKTQTHACSFAYANIATSGSIRQQGQAQLLVSDGCSGFSFGVTHKDAPVGPGFIRNAVPGADIVTVDPVVAADIAFVDGVAA